MQCPPLDIRHSTDWQSLKWLRTFCLGRAWSLPRRLGFPSVSASVQFSSDAVAAVAAVADVYSVVDEELPAQRLNEPKCTIDGNQRQGYKHVIAPIACYFLRHTCRWKETTARHENNIYHFASLHTHRARGRKNTRGKWKSANTIPLGWLAGWMIYLIRNHLRYIRWLPRSFFPFQYDICLNVTPKGVLGEGEGQKGLGWREGKAEPHRKRLTQDIYQQFSSEPKCHMDYSKCQKIYL